MLEEALGLTLSAPFPDYSQQQVLKTTIQSFFDQRLFQLILFYNPQPEEKIDGFLTKRSIADLL
ncbi:hypothetical protein [Halobacillus trueperi]|uniref:hypothetical protein n=1 Tax=Halobacillus trueperi TaxID=156205 RepID=UPI0037354121